MAEKGKIENNDLFTLEEVFKFFDKDGDGHITAQELTTAIRAMGFNPNKDELQDLVETYDKDQNGSIEFSEFVLLMRNIIQEQDEYKDLLETFMVFDTDQDGLLTLEGIKLLFNKFEENPGDEIINNFFQSADSDEDGFINYVDFIRTLTGK